MKIILWIFLALCLFTGCERDYETVVFIKNGGIQPVRDGENSLRVEGEAGPYPLGEKAALTVKGKPDTEYNLRVFLSSGESSAAGLGDAMSDEEGTVFWTWNVSVATKPGTFQAFVSGGGDYLSIEIDIVE